MKLLIYTIMIPLIVITAASFKDNNFELKKEEYLIKIDGKNKRIPPEVIYTMSKILYNSDRDLIITSKRKED